MSEEKDYKQIRREKLRNKNRDKYRHEKRPKLFEKGRAKKWRYEE